MEIENKEALVILNDTIRRIAKEESDNSNFDVTRNARITKVYKPDNGSVFSITGYDIEVDGKSYYIEKQSGKGITADENNIVKLHIPCNNMNNMYLSYAHDPEDFIEYFSSNETSSYNMYWKSKRIESVMTDIRSVTFPATTNQFSSTTTSFPMPLPLTSGYPYDIIFSADNGVWGVITSYNVMGTSTGASTWVNVTLYHKNPTTTTAVTKTCNCYVKAMGITS